MLIRQTLLYAPAQFVGPLAQFVGVVAWTHMLGPAEYGFVLLVLALQELGYVVGLSWWSSYTLRYLPRIRDRDGYQRCENAVLVLTALAQIPLMVAGLASTGHLFDLPLIVSTVLYAATRAVISHLSERARTLGNIGAYTVAQTTGPLLGLPLGLGLLHVMAAPLAITWGFAAVQIATIPFLVVRLGLGVPRPFRLDPAHLRAALLYGGPLLISGGFNWVSMNGIRFVVEYQEGAVALGLLSVGWNLGQRLMTLIATLVTAAAFPLAVKSFEEEGPRAGLRQLSRNAMLLLGLLVPASLGVTVLAAPMTNVLVGPEFRADTLVVLPLAALAAALRNVRLHFADQVFLLSERPRTILHFNIWEAAATLLFCWLGLRWNGLAGACLGCLLAYAILAACSFAVAVTRYRLTVPVGATLRFLLASLAMVAAIHLTALPPTWVGLALRVGLGLVIYAGLSAALWRDLLPRSPFASIPRFGARR